MTRFGAFITKGPQSWQVLQQQDGCANIALEGIWAAEDGVSGSVMARVVKEDSGEGLTPWSKAEDLGGKAWKAVLKSIPVGGPYRVETGFAPDGCAELEWMARGDMIHHIWVGDLYVIAGQSNSAGYGKDMIYDPPELGVHLLRNSGRWDLASHPMNESTGSVHPANFEGANPGHSMWLSFAKTVKRGAGMPVGLVQTALGASPLDAWLPGNTLYENMMDIIRSAGGRVRGVLWYQGCSDANEAKCDTYLERFGALVGGMRKELGDPGLPFFTVQLCRCVRPGYEGETDRAWSTVREAQRQATLSIPGVFVVPSIDCVLSDMIHVSAASNIVLGERAAKLALANVYGRPAVCDSPDIFSVRLTPDGVLLTFHSVSMRLFAYEAPVHRLPFLLTDEAGDVQISEYFILAPDRILLKLSRPLIGSAVLSSHFGRDPLGVAVIDAGTRLPALAFHSVPIN